MASDHIINLLAVDTADPLRDMEKEGADYLIIQSNMMTSAMVAKAFRALQLGTKMICLNWAIDEIWLDLVKESGEGVYGCTAASPTRSGPTKTFRDVMMATDTEGFDLPYKLKNKPEYRNVPIVLVTGFTQRMADLGPERVQHILREDWSASQMFEKPIDPDELLAAVEGLLKEQGK